MTWSSSGTAAPNRNAVSRSASSAISSPNSARRVGFQGPASGRVWWLVSAGYVGEGSFWAPITDSSRSLS